MIFEKKQAERLLPLLCKLNRFLAGDVFDVESYDLNGLDRLVDLRVTAVHVVVRIFFCQSSERLPLLLRIINKPGFSEDDYTSEIGRAVLRDDQVCFDNSKRDFTMLFQSVNLVSLLCTVKIQGVLFQTVAERDAICIAIITDETQHPGHGILQDTYSFLCG